MPFILLTDIYSYCNREKRYAGRYDQVQVISKKDHVLIVADRKGERFPVTEDNVLEVTDQELKQISVTNAALNELKGKINTPANAQRVRAQEAKIKQLLKI